MIENPVERCLRNLRNLRALVKPERHSEAETYFDDISWWLENGCCSREKCPLVGASGNHPTGIDDDCPHCNGSGYLVKERGR